MNRLEINLASSPFRNNIMFHLFHGFLIVLVLLVSVFNIYFFLHFRELRGEVRGVLSTSQDEMQALDKKAQKIKTTIAQKDIKEITERAIFANDVILMRKFFWTDLFNELEKVMPYSVKMQSIRPSSKEKGIEVNVEGMAKDLKSFFEFEKNLQSSPSFGRVRPENYRTIANSDLTFSLAFEYHQEGKNLEELYKEKAAFSKGYGERQEVTSPAEKEDAVSQGTGGETPTIPPGEGE